MAGYWQREKETAQAIRDGWLHTGDAAYMDDDGFIFLKDRSKDMIVSGGENVYPAEVEAVLMGHAEILECAVIGVPDARWGETVKAVVVRRARDAILREAALIDGAATSSPASSGRARSTSSTRCRATPAASSSSARCANRIGPVMPAGSISWP